MVEFDAEVGFSEAKTWDGQMGSEQGLDRLTSPSFDYSVNFLAGLHGSEVELLDDGASFV